MTTSTLFQVGGAPWKYEEGLSCEVSVYGVSIHVSDGKECGKIHLTPEQERALLQWLLAAPHIRAANKE